jgi:hypothetical protein
LIDKTVKKIADMKMPEFGFRLAPAGGPLPKQTVGEAFRDVKDFFVKMVKGDGDNRPPLPNDKGTGKAVSNLDEIKSLIKKGEIKGNNIICKIDDNTQVIFRKDTGSYAHPIRPKYPNPVDHFNIEIQTKTSAGKWKSRESYHIVVDKNGNIIDRI